MVPAGETPRMIRSIVNAALERLSRNFCKFHAPVGQYSTGIVAARRHT